MLHRNRIQVTSEESNKISKLSYLAIRYENLFNQAAKHNKATLEHAALYINAAVELETFREELRNKYPVLRKVNVFYFNYGDNYFYFE